MQWLNNLKIRAKLMVMMGVSLALTIAVGSFALWRMGTVNNEGKFIAETLLPSVRYLGEIDEATRRVQSLQYQHVAMTTEAALADIETRLDDALAALKASRAAYEALPATEEETAAYDRMTAEWDAYLASWPDARALSRNAQSDSAAAILNAALPTYREMDAELTKVSEINVERAKTATATAAEIYSQSVVFVVVALVLAAAIGVSLALLISGRIAKTVRVLADTTEALRTACISGTRRGLAAMAIGDLSVTVAPTTQPINNTDGDEIGDIARAVDNIIVDIRDTITAFSSTQVAITAVIGETQMLVDAASRGDLVKRADAQRHHGAYRQLVEGMNGTLAAVAAPIGEAKTVLGMLADKDLTGRMSGRYEGDYAEMQGSINTAIENLEVALTQVSTASGQVASASSQITSGAQSLASGSSEQAASLEEVAASVHEFSTMATQSATNAQDAQRMSIDARSNATEGAARMQRLTEAVNEIKQSSAETAKIMKSIEEIAFQTNLLALNAAVEAARAGDAGRGFAVVADEVRSLAIRSAEASKTTAELIERGLASAERGVALNAEVSQSFEHINSQVGRVAEVMADIAESANRQASGVTEINSALEQLNQVTQQVAANAEESASAAEELSSQAAALADTAASFKLDTHTGSVSRRKPAPAVRRATVNKPLPTRRITAAAPSVPVSVGSADDPDSDAFLGF